MGDELRSDRSLPKFAQAITLYHLIIEASMAQPGQHYIEDFFTKEGSMPGFSEGMHNVARDEQRHIGFGVKVLSELLEESDECKAAVEEIMSEMFPFLVSVFVPPDWDERYTTSYGFTMQDIYSFGMRSVEAKWKAIGFPLPDMMKGALYPFDPEMPHTTRADRQIKLLKAGVLGEPNGIAPADPEVQEIYFDVVARSADTDALDAPMTVQWDFTDADPWHVRLNNGSSTRRAGHGPRRRPHPRDDLGPVDPDLDAGREPAEGDADPQAPPAAAACGTWPAWARSGNRATRRRRLSPGASASGPRTRRL